MKVALVVPALGYPHLTCMTTLHFPNGLAYLAAALKQAGHTVIGFNPNNDFSYPSAQVMLYTKLRLMIETESPQLIGLSGLCSDYQFLKDAIAIIRTITPTTPIVCGGGILTHDAEFIFNQLRPDFGVMWEGEEVLCQLVHALETGDTQLEAIPNLWYWCNSNACFSYKEYAYPDLDSRPFPDYTPFNMKSIIEDYALAQFYPIRYNNPYPKVMPLVAARSCPFSCSFCVHGEGPRYRARSMRSILDEIKQNYDEYTFNHLFIADELFAIDRNRLKEFCQGIAEGRKQYGWDFTWGFNTHANAAFGRHELEMARDAGCSFFSYGIESASPNVLASMNKRTNPAQIAEAITLANEVGLGFGGNFIFGDVAETPETIMESVNFFIDYCMDCFVSLIEVYPYPGSRLFDYCLEKQIIPDKLQYYETIDAKSINMTAYSDAVWFGWLGKFVGIVYPSINIPIPFLKSVSAVSCYRESQQVEIAPGDTKTVWQVYVACPHCSKAMLCRELLYDYDMGSASASFVTACPVCHKRFNVNFDKPPGVSLPPPQERYLSAEVMRRIAYDAITVFAKEANGVAPTEGTS